MRLRQFTPLPVSLALLLALTACAGSPFGSGLEESLEADPRLAEEPAQEGDENNNSSDANSDSPDPTEADTQPPQNASAALDIEDIPQAGDPDFVGPTWTATAALGDSSTPNPTQPQRFTDLDQTPEELASFVQDMANLGLMEIQPAADAASSNEPTLLKPNQAITRREYARWLVTANNLFYADRADYRIRLGVTSFKPAFQDIPTTDPDFPAIQGLAEAGLIPSALTGSTTSVNFRPDAPVTRETLILWKAPLDVRQTLPSASIEAVEQVWGFQDTAQVEPRALQAILADHQNGEFANIRRAFSFTTLFQPKKAATRAEAAVVLWRFGNSSEGITAQEILTQAQDQAAE